MIYWLDADLHGADSISDVIATGKVKHIECPSFKAFNAAVKDLIFKQNVGSEDVVIVDTITQLLDTTRADAKLGTDENVDLFERGKAKYLDGDKQFLNVYQMAQQIVMRAIKNLRARKVRVIVLAQEDERVDETTMTKKRMPEVNPGLMGPLIAASSDVFRLYSVPEDIQNAKGETTVPRDTRVLYLRNSDDYIAKYNVPFSRSAEVPKYVKDPTLPKLYETLGKKSVFLLVYGAPGSGKTTLAVSEAATQTKTKAKQ